MDDKYIKIKTKSEQDFITKEAKRILKEKKEKKKKENKKT